MKRFRFRLQPLLNIRKHTEREKQRELAAASTKVQNQKDRLGELHSDREATVENQRARMSGKLSTANLLTCTRYLLKLRKDTFTESEILRELEKAEDLSRYDLMGAAKERRKYERLKEIRYEAFLKEFDLQERKETDDLVTGRFRHKTG